MGRHGFAAVTIAGLWLLTPGGTADAFEARSAQSVDAAAVTDVSAQSRRRRAERRANLRIIVRPPVRRSPLEFNVFPRPEPYDWPGPGFVRDCVGWLEPEWRLSGTVIVPRRRCAWVPG
jgi:hypothetical protein